MATGSFLAVSVAVACGFRAEDFKNILNGLFHGGENCACKLFPKPKYSVMAAAWDRFSPPLARGRRFLKKEVDGSPSFEQ
jgi:hypothetical protein